MRGWEDPDRDQEAGETGEAGEAKSKTGISLELEKTETRGLKPCSTAIPCRHWNAVSGISWRIVPILFIVYSVLGFMHAIIRSTALWSKMHILITRTLIPITRIWRGLSAFRDENMTIHPLGLQYMYFLVYYMYLSSFLVYFII